MVCDTELAPGTRHRNIQQPASLGLVVPVQAVRAQTERGPRILDVKALAEKRLSAALARDLFDDHSPPPEAKPRRVRMPQRDPGAGRPTKRERRDLERFRGNS